MGTRLAYTELEACAVEVEHTSRCGRWVWPIP